MLPPESGCYQNPAYLLFGQAASLPEGNLPGRQAREMWEFVNNRYMHLADPLGETDFVSLAWGRLTRGQTALGWSGMGRDHSAPFVIYHWA